MAPVLSSDTGSFKDPSGRVYRVSGQSGDVRILRGLSLSADAVMRKLLTEPFFQELVSGGDVVDSVFVGQDDSDALTTMADVWHSVLEHQLIDFVTYPYEWPFSMLKDAALLQLRLLETAAQNGWILKDATPFNVQWDGVRPIFIDTPSFIPWEEGEYWRGYRQFCSTFLIPLMLTAHLGVPFQPLLRSQLDGIPPGEASAYFYGLRLFKRGVLSHVWFPARAERKARKRQSAGVPSRETRSRRRQPRTVTLALLDSLKRLVRKLSYGPTRSDWSQYSQSHSYSQSEFRQKKDFVVRNSAGYRPDLTWDIGSNTGEFSRAVAHNSRTVVALDSDQDAIELLYRDLRLNGPQNILPLVMDLSNLSPGQGWAGLERLPFDKRRSPDMVICLALIHHMRVTANIPISMFLDWLRTLNASVILEFISRDDEMFQQLLANKQETYSDYTSENFEAEVCSGFLVRDRLELKDGLRELFLLEPA